MLQRNLRIGLMATSFTFLAIAPVLAQEAPAEIDFNSTDLGHGIFMIEGVGGFAGGNMGLSVGDDGVILIDDSMPPFDQKLRAIIKSLTNSDIDYLINTHIHGDHTGNNLSFGSTGAVIVSHNNIRNRFIADGIGIGGGKTMEAPKAALPVITFSNEMSFHLNGNTAHLIHVENAHTDGDSIIHFKSANIIHTGDIFFNGMYPYIDTGSGGGINGYIAGQEATYALADDSTKIIPGHGPLANRNDLKKSIDMLKDLRGKVSEQKSSGKSLQEVLAGKLAANYSKDWTWGFITDERIITAIYSSL